MRYFVVSSGCAFGLLFAFSGAAQTAPAPSETAAPPSSGAPTPAPAAGTAPSSGATQPSTAPPAAPPPAYSPPAGYPPPAYGYPQPGAPPPTYSYAPQGYYAAPGSGPPATEEAAASGWRPNKGGVVLAVERIVGVFSARSFRDGSNSDDTAVVVDVAGNTAFNGLFDPFAAPQFAIHGVVGGGVSIGGTLGVLSLSPDTSSSRDETLTVFTFGPRIGGVIPLGQKWAIWVKGGVTFTRIGVESSRTTTSCNISTGACSTTTSSSSDDLSFTALSVDPMFSYFPIPHVGLLFGPAIDIGVAASSSSSSGNGTKYSSFGVAAGLAVFL